MYGAIQALGSLDIDIVGRHQTVKKKATKIIQKCNELLGSAERGVGPDPEKSDKIQKKEPLRGH